MRPTLAWLLRRAAHLIEAAFDLIPPELVEAVAEGKLPGSPQELVDAVANGIENTFGSNGASDHSSAAGKRRSLQGHEDPLRSDLR